VRLAALLAAGRPEPRLAVESVLLGAPSWLSKGKGHFEIAVATYATEHGHPDLAAEAFARAATYRDRPADILRGYAALSAVEAGDADRASQLMGQVEADPASSLLLATADAVVGHLGKHGPVPIPTAVAAAGAAQRAAEPTCLAFLGMQALRRQDADMAIGYFEQAHAAHPEGSSLMLQLAQALQMRVGMGLSAVAAEDLRRIEELAQEVLKQRRRWSGPSEQALAMLIRRHAQVGAFEQALRLATPGHSGAAVEREAAADEVVILGVQAAQILGDDARAAEFAGRAETDYTRAVTTALTAARGLSAAEQEQLWREVLTSGALPSMQMLAWHRLSGLGVWPLPGVEELRALGEMDDMHYEVLQAHAMAGNGDTEGAISFLRGRVSTSPMATEALVDLLQEQERFDQAMDEAARGHERFGDAVLAHKRLNLLVLSGRSDAAAEEAIHLLARPDTAPELRLRTYRRLIGHFAHRGDWAAIERQARAALVEFPGTPDLQWDIIGAAHNQGRPERAQSYYGQFHPEIVTIPHAGLWLSLHMRSGFTQEDVESALDLLDHWPDDELFETQVMAAFLGATGRRAPNGEPVLPDLDGTILDRFQSRLRMLATRGPDGPIRFIAADPQNLVEMLRSQLAPHTEQVELIKRHVRDGRIWLGPLSILLGQSYAEALIRRAAGIILAVTADPPVFALELDAVRAALNHPVVIESSAITVATVIPRRWAQLRGAFTDLRIPRDVWNDFQAARDNLLRDPKTTFSVGYDPRHDALVYQQPGKEEHDYLSIRFGQIDKALQDLTVLRAPALGDFRRYAADDADTALSPLALAAETGVPLWSDDVVLRVLAREHRIPAFGTMALLEVLVETGRLEDTLRDDVLHLTRGYVADLLLTTDELASLAAEDRYQTGPATMILTRPIFWANPAAGQQALLEVIIPIHAHAPETTPTWFRAACLGLAAREPNGTIEEHTRRLAEAVSRCIAADDDLHAQLIHIAAEVAQEAAEAHSSDSEEQSS
jgi:tetratricopeptide (TPR) repeat protein